MQMREQWHVKARDENPWQRGRQAAVCAWVCKTEGDTGEEATPNATPSTRSIKPSAFQTSVDVRHAGALIAARYATGSAVTPISTSPQPAVSAKGAGYRVKHEMLDAFLRREPENPSVPMRFA